MVTKLEKKNSKHKVAPSLKYNLIDNVFIVKKTFIK